MRVSRPAPATVDLGPRARVLSLVRVDGPGDSSSVVAHTLEGRTARQGYFQLVRWKEGDAADATGRTAYVWVEVVEWNQAGPHARVRLQTRLARTPDGPWSEPFETGALVEGTEGATDVTGAVGPQLLVEASLRAVDDLLRELAPRPRIEEVELDVDSPLLQPGAAAAERGELGEARASFTSVHERHPDLPGAAYDLGLVLETLGELEQAEALYLQALSMKDDRLYRDALQSVRVRLQSGASGFPP